MVSQHRRRVLLFWHASASHGCTYLLRRSNRCVRTHDGAHISSSALHIDTDGTTNFVHGFPFACISIGLIDQKRPVLGVIYNPFLDHLYHGVKGQGSYLVRNGGAPQKLPLYGAKPLPSLSQALIGICGSLSIPQHGILTCRTVAIEWGSDRKAPTIVAKSDSFLRLAGDPANGIEKGKMAHSLRSVGSAALNFALVAQGGLDMYWCVSDSFVYSDNSQR